MEQKRRIVIDMEIRTWEDLLAESNAELMESSNGDGMTTYRIPDTDCYLLHLEDDDLYYLELPKASPVEVSVRRMAQEAYDDCNTGSE